MGNEGLYNCDVSTLSEGQFGFATPRTVAYLSDQMLDLDAVEQSLSYLDPSVAKPLAAKYCRVLATSIVGKSTAAAFGGYLDVMHRMPSPEDVMSGVATELGDVELSQSFGLLYGLVYNLETIFTKHYDSTLSRDEPQPEQWTVGRDNILNFILNNFNNEAGAWVQSVVFQQTTITAPALRSPAYQEFTKKFLSTITRVLPKRRAA